MQRLVMVRSSRWMRVARFLIAAFGGLLTVSSIVSVPAVAQGASRNLDAELLPRGGSARIDMMPGRLNKLPVSWFERREIVIVPVGGGERRVAFRTNGCEGDADTGLIVTWGESVLSPSTNGAPVVRWTEYTAFDNDGNTADNGRCSLIDTGSHAGSVVFTVYVFSMTRATSRASLQQKFDDGPWTTLSTDDYGGTLVRVGALQSGDFLEVQTSNDGVGNHDNDWTRMLLFQPPAPGATRVAKAAIFDLKGAPDRDPRIEVDGSWSSPFNAVLLGKVRRTTTTQILGVTITLKKGVETRVDLVRGPLEASAGAAPLSCSGTTCIGDSSLPLPRGRYYASLYAKTPNPLGAGDGNFADALGTDGDPNGGYCPHIARGFRGNDLAFGALLNRNGNPLRVRWIPRGLLGDGEGFNRIVMEIDADGQSSYSLDVLDKAGDVTFFDKWEFVRNPEVNEIKVATWNFAKWAAEGDPDPTQTRTAILKNAADLFGTRGDLLPLSRRVVEPANQAPWQWDADVIAFQEFWNTTYGAVRDRLRNRTPFGWNWVNAVLERAKAPPHTTHINYGPVFVNEFLWPADGIKYSSRQLVPLTPCDEQVDQSEDYSCKLSNEFDIRQRYAVPLKLSARRKIGSNADAGTDRPVAFFNWHLFHLQSAFSDRVDNVEKFIQAAKSLMGVPADGELRKGACAFNKDCEVIQADQVAKHASTRMIIVGDTNAKHHECGEFTWMLRRLREEFGYAIDVSAATVDSRYRTFDMHWSGAPITRLEQSKWTTCTEENGPHSKTVNGDGSATGCPFHFQNRLNWHKGTWNGTDWVLPKDLSTASWYPWWAATFQDVDGGLNLRGQRYDVVFLVGRGWAYDDPVLSYKVMPHYDEPSPMNGRLGGGVQLGYKGDCKGRITEGARWGSYAPKEAVCSHAGCTQCGNAAGAPAIRSDHIPVGARLRVWGR